MHWLVAGSSTQTAGVPFFIGMPSAPGYVPKYESNDRFSCWITMMCLILWIPSALVVVVDEGGAVVDEDDGVDADFELLLLHEAATKSVIPTTARTRPT